MKYTKYTKYKTVHIKI